MQNMQRPSAMEWVLFDIVNRRNICAVSLGLQREQLWFRIKTRPDRTGAP